MKFTLPISPEYVAHWGLWEAVREIYQNALDQGEFDREYYPVGQQLCISSSGRLTPETLVLGTSSKRADETKRGKFGEGYKLALLVLARLNYPTKIFTNNEIWTPALEHDPQFNTTVLTVTTEPNGDPGTEPDLSDRVWFVIENVTSEDYVSLCAKIRPENSDQILDDPREAGRIYVGGLYVSTATRFRHGYAFRPGQVKLDRDRGMIDGFDLAYATSKLWTDRGHSARLSELLEAEAPDVEYVESHAQSRPDFANDHYNYYVSRHGYDAIPVSDQAEIQRAQAAGVRWVLVPEKVKAMLHLVKSWFIPDGTPLIQQLKEFQKNYRYYLPKLGQHRLDEIIKNLEP